MIIRLLAAVVLGLCLLSIVYCIPTDRMHQNMERSKERFDSETAYHYLYRWCNSTLDNFTDAIMLLNAVYQDDSPAIVQAVSSKREYVSGLGDPYGEIIAHYLEGREFDGTTSYMRYWHGYLVVLKPLLYFTTYHNIRIINAMIQCSLVLIVIVLMYRNRMKKYILPFMITIAMLMPIVIAKSLQFSTCYYLSLIGCVVILLAGRKEKTETRYIFLYLGLATAYFDFLTYPIATLGLPAVLYYCKQDCSKLRECFLSFFRMCVNWCFGYVGMWSAKWVLGSLITGQNVLADAFEKIKTRSSHADVEVFGEMIEDPAWNSYIMNRDSFMNTPVAYILKLFVIIALFILVIAILTRRVSWRSVICVVPFLWIMVLPIAWYMFTANHSIIHFWFTNKGLSVSALAIMCMIMKCFDGEGLSSKTVAESYQRN